MTNDIPWFERIRKRPGMYVGPTDQSAMCRLIWDAIDEAVDTAINSSCRRISITIHPDCSLTIVYDGIYPETLAPDPRTALTDMATQYGWQPYWRLTPIPVINALAEHLTLDIFTGTHHFQQRFRGGQPISSVKDTGSTIVRGRRLHFVPDRAFFSNLHELSAYAVLGHLRTVAALAPQLCGQFSDERTPLLSEFAYGQGIRSYLIEQDYERDTHPQPPLYCAKADKHIAAEVTFHWCNRGRTSISSYVNWRATAEGGSHVAGFWRGLTRSLDHYARQHELFQADIPPLRRRQVPQPLTAIIAVRVDTPKYRDASLNILHDPVVKAFVVQMLQEQLPAQFATDPSFVAQWIERHAWFIRDKDS
jgi:DNA gyrase subunit B